MGSEFDIKQDKGVRALIVLSELRFNAAGFGWKSYQSEENDPVTFNGSDVRSAAWYRVARHFQLRLNMRQAEKGKVTFDGFRREVRTHLRRRPDEYSSL